ncbi:DUF3693 domain-containing protein [Xanthomonas vasicola]|uniref:DUF3693 domain-containing protein n=1 Tax=Xanthomonas vasicola TaxID=56459 RepID=UPI003CCFDB1A
MRATGSKNDSELASHLGIKPAAVSNYRRGVSLPNAVVCATLAGLTGEPLAKVLGVIGEARAIGSDEKAVWRRLATSALALLLIVGSALPERAEAAVHHAFEANNSAPSIHYAKWALAALKMRARWLWLWLTSLLPSRGPSDTEIAA